MFIVRFPVIFYVCRCEKTPVCDLARKHLDEMAYQALILTMPPFQHFWPGYPHTHLNMSCVSICLECKITGHVFNDSLHHRNLGITKKYSENRL